MITWPVRISAAVLVLLSQFTPAEAVRWENVKTARGTVKNTTVRVGNSSRNNRNRYRHDDPRRRISDYRVRPVYINFSLNSPGLRVNYKTSGTGDRPDLKIELEKQVKRGKRTDWQRVAVVGRARGEGEGGRILASGPGSYRFKLTGRYTSYTLTVQAARRE